MKKIVQKIIGKGHELLMSKPLPSRLAIYFHQLDDTSFDLFTQTLQYLKGVGYDFVDNSDYAVAQSNRKVANISFDDNYSNWVRAMPVFKHFGGVGVFYTNTSILDEPAGSDFAEKYYRIINKDPTQRPLKEEELKQIALEGHEVGAHTHTHPNLGKLNEEDICSEIEKNIDILSNIIGKKIKSFSYPFGMPRNCPINIWDILNRYDIEFLAHGAPGMQYANSPLCEIHRSVFRSSMSFDRNLKALTIDGAQFVKLFGVSPAEI